MSAGYGGRNHGLKTKQHGPFVSRSSKSVGVPRDSLERREYSLRQESMGGDGGSTRDKSRWVMVVVVIVVVYSAVLKASRVFTIWSVT